MPSTGQRAVDQIGADAVSIQRADKRVPQRAEHDYALARRMHPIRAEMRSQL